MAWQSDSMDDDQVRLEDPGRSDFVPAGQAAQYPRRFKIGDKVWMKTSGNNPDIVVEVKNWKYHDEAGKEGWVYLVQEKDRDGNWIGREKWKRETALNRA